MKIEIKELNKKDMKASELEVGTIFICSCGDGIVDDFVAMITIDTNGTIYVLDLEEATLYDDVENYYVVRVIDNCVLREIN